MTQQANRYYIQETLHNMNLQDGPSRPGTPLRESHPVTPEAGQYNSHTWTIQKRTSPAKPISTVRKNIQMQRAGLAGWSAS